MSEQQSRILANGIHINSARGPTVEKISTGEEPIQSEEMIQSIGTDLNTDDIANSVVKKIKNTKFKPYLWE